jgi:hypothetical protein
MNALQFTNAFSPDRRVAVYAQQQTLSKFVDFERIAAGISLDVYGFAIIICCLLVGLFAFIEHVRSFHSEFYIWRVTTAILPCFNSQAPALEHDNSPSRCVAIIVTSIFVFFCTTYYETLLLSIHKASTGFTQNSDWVARKHLILTKLLFYF